MSNRKKKLRKLSKNQLIDIIFELEKRLAKLEKYLKAFDNAHTPPSKKKKKKKKKNKPKKGGRFPGKPKGSNGGGIRMPPADEHKEHTLDVCPDCKNELGEPVKKTTQKQMDLPEKLNICTEHTINHYHCQHCNCNVSAKEIKGRYGPRVRSFAAFLKEKGMSCGEIANTMKQMGFASFSPATVISIMVFFSTILQPIRDWLRQEALSSSYMHADETGLRKDGQSGYVWGFFTKNIALLNATLSRGKKIANNVLKKFSGVVVADGYNGYTDVSLRQRCWVHLIREFEQLAQKHDEARVFEKRIRSLYGNLSVYVDDIPNEKVKSFLRFTLDDIAQCLSAHKWGRKLANHIKNGGDDWFTVLDYPGVPFQNNLAERGLRRIVMHRKIMGCYRNEVGKNWIDVCLSVMQTWRMQNKNILQNLIYFASN